LKEFWNYLANFDNHLWDNISKIWNGKESNHKREDFRKIYNVSKSG
jgi:hypothetical protein